MFGKIKKVVKEIQNELDSVSFEVQDGKNKFIIEDTEGLKQYFDSAYNGQQVLVTVIQNSLLGSLIDGVKNV